MMAAPLGRLCATPPSSYKIRADRAIPPSSTLVVSGVDRVQHGVLSFELLAANNM